jgi:hypothetical protein
MRCDERMALMSNPYVVKAATYARLLKRSCESLIAMSGAFLADGHLADEEIHYLDSWLADNA